MFSNFNFNHSQFIGLTCKILKIKKYKPVLKRAFEICFLIGFQVSFGLCLRIKRAAWSTCLCLSTTCCSSGNASGMRPSNRTEPEMEPDSTCSNSGNCSIQPEFPKKVKIIFCFYFFVNSIANIFWDNIKC